MEFSIAVRLPEGFHCLWYSRCCNGALKQGSIKQDWPSRFSMSSGAACLGSIHFPYSISMYFHIILRSHAWYPLYPLRNIPWLAWCSSQSRLEWGKLHQGLGGREKRWFAIGSFHKWGTQKKDGLWSKIPLKWFKMDDLGVPLFQELPNCLQNVIGFSCDVSLRPIQ